MSHHTFVPGGRYIEAHYDNVSTERVETCKLCNQPPYARIHRTAQTVSHFLLWAFAYVGVVATLAAMIALAYRLIY